jgi:peptidoglycan/LPS O-acetylase OafA/YrhL
MSAASGPAAAPEHLPEIDALKGLAILGVLLIHSEPLAGSWFHTYIVNEAVPVLMTLFGVTSEYWWRRHADPNPGGAVRRWYTSRLRRLIVPVWAVVLLWWCWVAVIPSVVGVTPLAFAASLLGYTPTMAMSWFITLILQWIILFPGVRWCVVRFGRLPCLAASLVVHYFTYWYCLDVMEVGEALLGRVGRARDLFYLWIFPPQFLLHVVAGVTIARTPALARPSAGVAAIGVFVAGAYLHHALVTNVIYTCSRDGLQRLLDVALTLALLFGFRLLRSWAGAGLRWLVWCGLASWGLYLGQMLIHECLHLAGLSPETGPLATRWLYFAVLLLGALALVRVGGTLRDRLAV